MAQDSVGSTARRNRNRPASGRFAAREQGSRPVDLPGGTALGAGGNIAAVPGRRLQSGSTGGAQLYAALVLVAWWTLWRRDRTAALLVAAPILATLAAATVHLYPFADRLVLFLAPLVCLMIGSAMDETRRLLASWSPALGVAVVLGLLGPTAGTAVKRRPVIRRHEARPVLAYLAAHGGRASRSTPTSQPGRPLPITARGWASSRAVFPSAAATSAGSRPIVPS